VATSDVLKRYLEAGMAFTHATRERAESIVRELVRAGAIRKDQAEERVEQLLADSRRRTEELQAFIRQEVADQLEALGLEDLARRARTETPETTEPAPTTKEPAKARARKEPAVAEENESDQTAVLPTERE
jgi:polyhydroxyalkanoate synthesis regulator phasin